MIKTYCDHFILYFSLFSMFETCIFTIQIVFFLSLSHSLLLNNPLSALNGIWGLTLKYIYCIYCIYLSYIYYRGTHKEWDFTEFLQLFYNIIGFQVSSILTFNWCSFIFIFVDFEQSKFFNGNFVNSYTNPIIHKPVSEFNVFNPKQAGNGGRLAPPPLF